MNLDLRIPMGLMFLLTGAILALFGLYSQGSPIYEKSLGININAIWGVVLFVFGFSMYVLGVRRQKRIEDEKSTIKPKTIVNPKLRREH
jgi:ABC-type Fe3+-siderophore transport system permease subunit